MTTQPEARLFRLSARESRLGQQIADGVQDAPARDMPRQGGSVSGVRIEVHREGALAGMSAAERLMTADDDDDGLPDPRAARTGGQPATPAGQADTGAAAADDDLAQAVAAVAAEGLTARQLRIAERIAASNDIPANSPAEAVVRLRARGIDPFHRASLRGVVAAEGERGNARPTANVPSILVRPVDKSSSRGTALRATPVAPGEGGEVGRPIPPLPSREELTEERRASEIRLIQLDIARRRRRRMLMLGLRLASFVLLPTLVAGWYYFTQATRQYATVSQFQIQKAEAASSTGLGSLFSGTQMATNTDSVAVQSYLTSRDAMLRLDKDLDFKRTFQDPSIDPLLRLPADASNEKAYGVYKDSVRIGYDPTEGVINMEVIAPDPVLSQRFSVALIGYAEGQVDQMTARLRDDQMAGAQESYNEAERKVGEAQRRIQELQQQLGVLDPAAEGSAAMQQIASLETELTQKQLELGQLQANARPNASRVSGVQGDISRLEGMIAERRASLTQGSDVRNSLATITGELRIAEGDLLTRQQLLATAAAQMEAARIEANRQVRYLSLSVAPVPPDEPTYPKAVQNTIVAFLIFSGIYLMLSLTASILREQVSA